MKFINFVVAIVVMLFGAVSCGKTVIPEPAEQQLTVNFTNTSGEWKLESWKGSEMPLDVMISLKAKEFVLWQNVGSMYPVKYTGNYNLIEVDGYGTVIRGIYDYTYEYWKHEYIITSLTKSRMEWRAMDAPDDIQIFVRTDGFPKE